MCIHSDSIRNLFTRHKTPPKSSYRLKQHCICTDSWDTLIDAGSCNPWPAAKIYMLLALQSAFFRHFHLSSPWLSNLWIGPPKLGGHVWSFKEKERMSSLWPGIHFASQLWCWNLKWQSLWFVIANRIKQFPSSSNMHNFWWSWECPSRTPTTSTICITVTLCAIELIFLNLLSFNNCKPWSSSECTCYLDVPKSNTKIIWTPIYLSGMWLGVSLRSN